MKLLIDTIKREAVIKSEDVIDVSSFLNMQIDTPLLNEIGRSFADHYKDYDFDLFVTVESSGIAPSVFASLHAGKPLVVIKKSNKIMPHLLQQENTSFTKEVSYYLTVNASFIANKRIILLDDFLARGNVVTNVEILLAQADACLVSTGIVISKNFQAGYTELTKAGKDLFCLAQIKQIDPATDTIIFER
jgi:xanthine phosphoribosyltransferase